MKSYIKRTLALAAVSIAAMPADANPPSFNSKPNYKPYEIKAIKARRRANKRAKIARRINREHS